MADETWTGTFPDGTELTVRWDNDTEEGWVYASDGTALAVASEWADLGFPGFPSPADRGDEFHPELVGYWLTTEGATVETDSGRPLVPEPGPGIVY